MKDLGKHTARMHPGDAEEEQDHERELLRAQLEAAEKAEKEAKRELAQAREQQEAKERAHAEAPVHAPAPAQALAHAPARAPSPSLAPAHTRSLAPPAQMQANEQVQLIGSAIKDDMLKLHALPGADVETHNLQLTLSFVPGRPPAAVAPAVAIQQYKAQSAFGRRIDLRTRFAAGCLARRFYAYEGGPSLSEAAAARQGVNFETFCSQQLGVDAKVVRAEICFSLLCDMAPALLAALCTDRSRAELFSWADIASKSATYVAAWKQWMEENGFVEVCVRRRSSSFSWFSASSQRLGLSAVWCHDDSTKHPGSSSGPESAHVLPEQTGIVSIGIGLGLEAQTRRRRY